MRVALVHEWLTAMRGGERVLEALLGLVPDAEIFTLVHRPDTVSAAIESRPIHASFIDRLPLGRSHYRHFLPLFPAAVERFDLSDFDFVISNSHCVAKSVITPAGVPHLCYCHTPMRYVWDQYASYFGPGRAPLAIRAAMRVIAPRLRTWDAATAARPTAFVASSENARNRIRRHYGRDVAAVVYPPVDVDRFRPAPRRDDFYLSVGALVPYKRLDIAVDAFRRTGRRLVIAGDGPDRDRLARRAGRTIEFAGRLDDAAVADLMARCRAFVMPGEEDFGIAPVEAQAAGAPVIALAKGGSLETVAGVRGEEERPDATGVFFDQPTPDALIGAIEVFEKRAFDPAALHVNARRFAPDRFRCGMRAQLDALLAG